ncbi:hypothetical protein MEO41_29075, partial [Dolichospermum sp. ST_sed4]|nr:hypothetical protein [Dolichospermum sp. ST_sed4]
PVVEDKPTKLTDTETTVWDEAQKGNTADDYQVYLGAYPKGKFAGFAKARIKKLKAEQTSKVKPIVSTPQTNLNSFGGGVLGGVTTGGSAT